MTRVFLQLSFIITLTLSLFMPFKAAAQGSEAIYLNECRKFTTDQAGSAKLASDNVNKIFYPLKNGILVAVDINDAKTIWKTELGGEIEANILYDREKIFVVTSNLITDKVNKQSKNYVVRSISAGTGLTLWQQTIKPELAEITDKAGNEANLISDGDSLFFLNESRITVIDKADGSIKQLSDIKLNISSDSMLADKSMFGEDFIKAVFNASNDKESGEKTAQFNANPIVLYIGNTKIFVADILGVVYAFSRDTRKMLWRTRTGAEVINLKENDKNLLVSSNDNYVYSFSESNGNINWKKRFSGRNAITVADDGQLMFSVTINGDTLTITSLKKGKTVNQAYLKDDEFFTNNLLLLKNFIAAPTNSGFTVYSLTKCSVTAN